MADLAGRNYNEGKGTLVDVMSRPGAAERYAHLKDKDGKWAVRSDVWVRYQREKQPLQAGPLALGFGAYVSQHHFGPEFQFGHVVGAAYRDQVLLIKTAWGGKSLYRDFRPPSAGGEVGPYYVKMVAEVREALANLKKDFPAYDGAEVELAGFVWYQGWNDGVNPKTAVPEYEQNLAHLIRDIRKEFGAPKLPVIVGELTGPWVDAPKEWTALRQAQANVANYPEFKDNVIFVPTRTFVRKPEDSPNPGHGHHEFGNAETYFLVGDALGKAAVQMAGRDRQIRQIRGWTLRIDERLIAKDAAAVEKAVVIMDAQLAKVERLIPAKAVERLRSVPLNFSLPYPDRRPTAEYHGDLAWVKKVGREIALGKAIEFTNVARFDIIDVQFVDLGLELGQERHVGRADHDCLGVELVGIEGFGEFLVFLDRDSSHPRVHDPFADAVVGLAFHFVGQLGIEPPVDEHRVVALFKKLAALGVVRAEFDDGFTPHFVHFLGPCGG